MSHHRLRIGLQINVQYPGILFGGCQAFGTIRFRHCIGYFPGMFLCLPICHFGISRACRFRISTRHLCIGYYQRIVRSGMTDRLRMAGCMSSALQISRCIVRSGMTGFLYKPHSLRSIHLRRSNRMKLWDRYICHCSSHSLGFCMCYWMLWCRCLRRSTG